VKGRHPHFFRKMVRKPDRPLPAGGPVFVRDRDGKAVGTGFYNPRSELALRMLARQPVTDPTQYILERLDDACDLRDRRLQLPDITSGYRLVHAEGDSIPGLIIDRLGDTIVAQVYALCVMEHMEAIGEALLRRYPGSRLGMTIDPDAARQEGIDRVHTPPLDPCVITEGDIHYTVAPGSGHKTGFFADQRETRLRVRDLARGRRVLDLCCNTGGFAMNAARGQAAFVHAADLDEVVLQQARENVKANKMKVQVDHADAFAVLKGASEGDYDLIILDPPKWARGKSEVEAALEKYRDLNQQALQKLSPGGLLVTCSCSGAVSPPRFQACVAEAASRARRDARILYTGGAGPDHPVALECPETSYLKTMILELR